MLFSSTTFVFAFLPVVLLAYFALRGVTARNALLLLASLFFYAWGETGWVAVLLASIACNWAFGLWIAATASGTRRRRRVLAGAVTANLLGLAVFKYTGFLAGAVAPLLAAVGLPAPLLATVHLPLGISFFTFQALTYLVDVHRRDAPVQRNPFYVGLYISLFPQLIAGPIVRYREVAAQLRQRTTRLPDLALGVRRFTIGLAKKVLVANTLAIPADRIFALPPGELAASVAWLGALCYALQIYFDFSGYSDMAIGLGRIFGFRFPENFLYPYTSRSVREFWRRWHVTLSSWFRDYVYLPLGGNRRGPARTHVNLLLVFFLCGLWHGASWSFVLWGLAHGAFMIAERTGGEALLARLPGPARVAYTFLAVTLAWVLFRADDVAHAAGYWTAMFGAGVPASGAHPLSLYLDARIGTTLAAALVGCAPWPAVFQAWLRSRGLVRTLATVRIASLNALFLGCAMALAAGTHDPFIYFRF